MTCPLSSTRSSQALTTFLPAASNRGMKGPAAPAAATEEARCLHDDRNHVSRFKGRSRRLRPAPAEPPAEQQPAEPQPTALQIIQEPAATQPAQTEAVQQPPQNTAPGEQPPAAETAPEQQPEASPVDPSPGNDSTGSGASLPSIDQPVDFLKSLLGQ